MNGSPISFENYNRIDVLMKQMPVFVSIIVADEVFKENGIVMMIRPCAIVNSQSNTLYSLMRQSMLGMVSDNWPSFSTKVVEMKQ